MQLLGVNGATLRLRGLDVIDGTRILDIKPYTPPYDVPQGEVRVPDWVFRLKY